MSGISEKSFTGRIILLLSVLIAGFIILSALYMLIIFAQSGFDITKYNMYYELASNNPNMIRILQALSTICIFIFPSFILVYLYKENVREYLSLRSPQPMQVIVAVLSLFFAIPIINFLVTWNEGLHLPAFLKDVEIWMRNSEDSATFITKKLLSGNSINDLFANLIIIALLAGIGEELFFRGLLQKILSELFKSKNEMSSGKKRWADHATIWIVAFLFSAIHLQFYGFIPRLLLGVWFGYMLLWTGSIMVPIMAHFTNNALSVISGFAEKRGDINLNPDTIGVNDTSWYCIISIFLLVCCTAFFIKDQKNNQGQVLQ
jgi:uncharacterized protein